MTPCPETFLRAVARTLTPAGVASELAARALRHQAERMLQDPADPSGDLAELVLQLDALQAELSVAETVFEETKRRINDEARAVEQRIEQIIGGAP